MAQERLQKILARAGIASRRAAEQLITGGRVLVNGKPVRELGTRADPERDRIEVDGRPIARERHVYYLIHKPRGIVTTLHDPEGRPSLDELLRDIPERVYPVGRLDFHTSGALLLTNDGDLAQALLHPSHAVPKTYVAKLSREIDDYMLHALRSGVVLDDGYKTQPAHVAHLRDEDGKSWLEITITEGKNRQIHRMVESLDTRVMRLSRLSFAGLSTDGLRPGALRALSREEITMLAREYLPREQAQARTVEDRDERAVALRSKRTRKGEGRGGPPGERATRGESRGAPSDERRRGSARDDRVAHAADRAKPPSAERSDPRRGRATTKERGERTGGERALAKAQGSRGSAARDGGQQRGHRQAEGETRGAETRRASSDRPSVQRGSQDRASTKKAAGARAEQDTRAHARSARPDKQKSSARVDSSKAARHKSRPT